MTIEEMRKKKQELGYSVADLSEETGIPVGTLTKIFSGQTQQPRRSTIQTLERFFAEKDPWHGWVNPEYRTQTELSAANMVCEAAISYGVPVKKQGEYTVEDLELLDEWPRAELIDGVLYDMAPPRVNHSRIAQEVYLQITDYIRKKKGNCEVFIAGAGVFLEDYNKNCLIPDLFICCDEAKAEEKGIYGPPDFVLEIISPSSERKDTVIKRKKYMEAGVREYWIMDTRRGSVFVYLKEQPIGRIHPLAGKLGMAIYDGELEIDLDAVAAIPEKYPKGGL